MATTASPGASPAAKMDHDKVQLVQTLLTVPEVFVYRVPPMKTAGGHRAEDWDLANPLKTCKLTLERLDNYCLVKLLSETTNPGGVGRTTSLFAQCIMTIDDDHKLEYYLNFVVDSSRYFVLKIEDKARGRQATIGIGFRERDDASNFRLSLQDYERSLEREKKAERLQEQYNNSITSRHMESTSPQEHDDCDDRQPESLVPQVSKLTLKEGEKIRIHLKGFENKESKKSSPTDPAAAAAASSLPAIKKAPMLLKKPPPPADVGGGASLGETLPIETEATTEDVEDDNEWGEFEAPPSA